MIKHTHTHTNKIDDIEQELPEVHRLVVSLKSTLDLVLIPVK